MSLVLPTKLLAPNIFKLKQFSIVHRIHDRNYLGDSFNPSQHKESRFSPIWNSDRAIIPVLYVASTLEAAVCETILHDLPPHCKFKKIRISTIAGLSHSVLQVKKDFSLVLLRNSDLRKWNISRTELINSTSDQYHETARWAETINRQFPMVDGLIWTSNQCDPDDAMIFFGNRVSSGDFDLVATREGASNTSFIDDISRIGERSNIEIIM